MTLSPPKSDKPFVRFYMDVTAPCGCVLSNSITHEYTTQVTPGNVRATADSAAPNLSQWAARAIMTHQCELVTKANPDGATPR